MIHGTKHQFVKAEAWLCRYYVRAVKKPKDRASIALAVRIGSVVEEEHERGVAHIVEHL